MAAVRKSIFLTALVPVLIIVAALCLTPFMSAFAETSSAEIPFSANEYVKVGSYQGSEQVILYNLSEDFPIMVIPNTYYVRYLRPTSSGDLRVQYGDLTGYIKAADLSCLTSANNEDISVDGTNSTLKGVKLGYNMSSEDEIQGYYYSESEDLRTALSFTPSGTAEFDYIAELTIDGTSYVFAKAAAGEYTYVYLPVASLVVIEGSTQTPFADYKAANFKEKFTHENSRPVDITDNPDQGDGEQTPAKEPTNSLLRVVLIIGIIVPAVIIIILLFKPGKKKSGYDYDRNRYYPLRPL